MQVAGRTKSGETFLQAPELAIRLRTDYDIAVGEFQSLVLENFNWALDYFDPVAAGNQKPALRIVDRDGTEHVRSFIEIRRVELRSLERQRRASSERAPLGFFEEDFTAAETE